MHDPLRLLVLSPLFPRSPGEKEGNFVLDQVRALAAQRAEICVVVPHPWSPPVISTLFGVNKQPVDIERYAGESFHVVNASYFSLPRYRLGHYAAYFAARGVVPVIRSRARQHPFDIIHAHGFPMGQVAKQAASELHIPYVLTIHGIETAPRFDDTEAKRRQIASAIENAARVILVGSPLLDYCRRYTANIENCVVIGNGFTVYDDLQPSTRIPRRKLLRVVATSNYAESKGFELIVEALAAHDLRDKFELVAVGGGEGFSRVRRRAQELGVADSVHCTGLLSHRDALNEVLAGDIFCLPSWREAYGIMYAEAMALGKLAIGCEGQGPSDFIRNRENGLLIAPRSAEAVAESLRFAVADSNGAKRIADRGCETALTSLTWSHNAARILSLYGNLLTAKVSVLL